MARPRSDPVRPRPVKPTTGRRAQGRYGLRILSDRWVRDRKSTRLNSSHGSISYAVFCLKKKQRVLQNLSKELDKTYDKAMKRIHTQYCRKVKRAAHVLAFIF